MIGMIEIEITMVEVERETQNSVQLMFNWWVHELILLGTKRTYTRTSLTTKSPSETSLSPPGTLCVRACVSFQVENKLTVSLPHLAVNFPPESRRLRPNRGLPRRHTHLGRRLSLASPYACTGAVHASDEKLSVDKAYHSQQRTTMKKNGNGHRRSWSEKDGWATCLSLPLRSMSSNQSLAVGLMGLV